jgi:Uma2 family endonuclease
MASGILIELDEQELIVPAEATADLAAFRRWALSDECPDSGRIDFIAGNIEIGDMAGEELFAHGTLKGKLYATILARVEKLDLGYVFTDSTRIASPEAGLSAEPDAAVVTYESIEAGRVRLVPKAGGEAGRYIEVEGPPDLVVEVVSDSTVRKDTKRLPRAYFTAGVKEFWLVDGRKELTFVVHGRGRSKFEAVTADGEGLQPSAVLGTSYRLDRTKDRLGAWRYDLVSK